MNRVSVGILGSTGMIGRHYLALLENHPWFEISFLSSSRQTSGTLEDCGLIFSALPTEQALEIEPKLAERGFPVISSASAHRNDPDIPLIIPEINAHHLNLIQQQRSNRQWKGFIVAKPNCSIQSFLLPLAPLHRDFKIKSLSITTLQAISGAGNDGLETEEFQDNVIPFIKDEEEKTENEPLKILDAFFPITAHCNRVPVSHGHLACISVSFEKKPAKEEILQHWMQTSSLELPSAPKLSVIYQTDPKRPQTRIDRDCNRGMSVTAGRLRPCPLFDWRFVALSHNLMRGGAGGGILIAELLIKEGYIG